MNNNSSDKYLRGKILLAKIMGVAVLVISMQFSQNGFGFKDQDIAYIGWVLAIAVTAVQFVFNSRVKNLNWTITILGVMSYVYSIWTNIVGFYDYQGKSVSFDTIFTLEAVLPIFASVFMDLMPESLLAWAFNASSEGDVVGNVLDVANNPDSIFARVSSQNNNRNNGNNNQQQQRQNAEYQNAYSNQNKDRSSEIYNNNSRPSGYPTPRQTQQPQKTYPTEHKMGMSDEDKKILIDRLRQSSRAREI